MMVASSVDLPTPFRPSTASEPRSGTCSDTSSRTTVSPQPARRLSTARRSATLLFAEVDLAHALVRRDLLRRAFHQDGAGGEHRDTRGEAEHQVHVVLDDQDRDI